MHAVRRWPNCHYAEHDCTYLIPRSINMNRLCETHPSWHTVVEASCLCSWAGFLHPGASMWLGPHRATCPPALSWLLLSLLLCSSLKPEIFIMAFLRFASRFHIYSTWFGKCAHKAGGSMCEGTGLRVFAGLHSIFRVWLNPDKEFSQSLAVITAKVAYSRLLASKRRLALCHLAKRKQGSKTAFPRAAISPSLCQL